MSTEEQREELRRILDSAQFRRAPKLQRFLSLICEYHFRGRSTEISEFLIATEAFGRGSDFDTSQDSIVRVQARAIRRRLKEYYEGPGRGSAVVLDLPLGTYVPVFTVADRPASAPSRAWKPSWALIAAASLLVIIFVLAADLIRLQSIGRSSAAAVQAPNPVLGRLWNRFLASDAPTILVLSNPHVSDCPPPKPAGNAVAAAAPVTPVASRQDCPDEYTGMGEAVALHLITDLFKTAKRKLTLKQSRLLTEDDVRRSNLILLGGKRANPWTRKLGQDVDVRAWANDPAPRPDTHSFPITFDSATGELSKDRAVIALRRNTETGHWLLFLYGAHSQGSLAVAEAVTGERFISKLNWPVPAAVFPDRFEILVGVTVLAGPRYVAEPMTVLVP
ncbi:MAG: hypothetical protein ACM336_03950 [Acidobacteriota bacterium]